MHVHNKKVAYILTESLLTELQEKSRNLFWVVSENHQVRGCDFRPCGCRRFGLPFLSRLHLSKKVWDRVCTPLALAASKVGAERRSACFSMKDSIQNSQGFSLSFGVVVVFVLPPPARPPIYRDRPGCPVKDNFFVGPTDFRAEVKFLIL